MQTKTLPNAGQIRSVQADIKQSWTSEQRAHRKALAAQKQLELASLLGLTIERKPSAA